MLLGPYLDLLAFKWCHISDSDTIAIEGCLYFWISVGKFLFCLGVKVLFEGYTAKTSSDSRKNETNIFEAKHKILSFGQFLLVSADIDI